MVQRKKRCRYGVRCPNEKCGFGHDKPRLAFLEFDTAAFCQVATPSDAMDLDEPIVEVPSAPLVQASGGLFEDISQVEIPDSQQQTNQSGKIIFHKVS